MYSISTSTYTAHNNLDNRARFYLKTTNTLYIIVFTYYITNRARAHTSARPIYALLLNAHLIIYYTLYRLIALINDV
nr:MAG TPA: hypothetical protein [Bacteriophage sp.]